MTSTRPFTKLQRYDAAGGCPGIDAAYGLERGTSRELLNSRELQRYARKFRKECLEYRYGKGTVEGADPAKQIGLPFADSDRSAAKLIWSARGDVRDLFQHSSSKIRLDWTVGERLGWAVLHVRSCLPVVRAADGEIVRLPIEHLDISQRGEWVMDLLEYDVHLRQKGVAA